MKSIKQIRKVFKYKGRSVRITQLKDGDWKAVVGGVFVIARTEEDALVHIKARIDVGW